MIELIADIDAFACFACGYAEDSGGRFYIDGAEAFGISEDNERLGSDKDQQEAGQFFNAR